MKEKVFSGLRSIVKGRGSGPALLTSQPINFLSMVDTGSGRISDPSHELHEKSLKSCVLVFPKATGSSVGAYVLYSLAVSGAAPSAILCEFPDVTTSSGCAIARIPLIVMPSDCELKDAPDGTILDVDAFTGQVIAKV